MDVPLLLIFGANLLLILLDASIGYFVAPVIVRLQGGEALDEAAAIRLIRGLLAGMVALYMFLNCLAYVRGSWLLLLVVTALTVSDMGVLLYLRNKWTKHGKGDAA